MRSLLLLVVIALLAASPVSARTHHRAAKPAAAPTTEAPAAVKSANVPEKDRDPEDIALDRKIKGICRGC
jgi:hypothetical protein